MTGVHFNYSTKDVNTNEGAVLYQNCVVITLLLNWHLFTNFTLMYDPYFYTYSCIDHVHDWISATRDDDTSSLYACLSCVILMYYTSVFSVQSLVPSVRHLLRVCTALLPSSCRIDVGRFSTMAECLTYPWLNFVRQNRACSQDLTQVGERDIKCVKDGVGSLPKKVWIYLLGKAAFLYIFICCGTKFLTCT